MKIKLFIITGASRGMGFSMAEQLLAPGHSLLCISRTRSSELTNEAHRRGAQLLQWACDLSEPQPVAARISHWLEAQDTSLIESVCLINNAGVIPPLAPLSESDPASLAQALRVGLEAPLVLTAAFLASTRHWSASRQVLNISSGLGRRPMASQAPYCAAKAGMDHFTRCLALDEASQPNGAKVCSLAPGVIDTDMQFQLRSADPARFPDQDNFMRLKVGGQLTSAHDAAARVLAFLERDDFGSQPVADVRG